MIYKWNLNAIQVAQTGRHVTQRLFAPVFERICNPIACCSCTEDAVDDQLLVLESNRLKFGSCPIGFRQS